jgi:hypothetical protein
MPGRPDEGDVGPDSDIPRAVDDLCAVKTITPAIVRPHFTQAYLFVELVYYPYLWSKKC